MTPAPPPALAARFREGWSPELDIPVLRRALELLDEPALLFDDDGRVRHCNAAAEVVFGRPRERLLGASFGDLLQPAAPTGREEGPTLLRQATQGALLQRLVRLRHNGTAEEAQLFAIPLRLSREEGGFLALVRAASGLGTGLSGLPQAQFRLLAEQTPDLVGVFTPKGVCCYISPACNRLGYAPEELMGTRSWDLLPPTDQRRARREFAVWIASGARDPLVFRHRVVDRAGNLAWYESSVRAIRDEAGQVAQLVVVSHDVAERLAVEQATARLTALAATSEDPLLLLDEEGRIVFANRAARAEFGPPGGLTGRPFEALAAPLSREAARDLLEHAERGRGDRASLWLTDAEGTQVARTALSVAARGAGGRFLGAAVRLAREARPPSPLAAPAPEAPPRSGAVRSPDEVASFLQATGHELRECLTGLGLALESLVLNEGQTPRRTLEERRDRAFRNAARLGALAEDLIEFALVVRAPERTAGHVDVATVLDALEGTLRKEADQAKVRLSLRYDRPLPATADERMLARVVRHLVRNALKVTPSQRTVEVTAVAAGGEVRLSVRDHGPGFDPAHGSRLFQPYGRLGSEPAAWRGGGLGLYISRVIVEGFGGRAWCRSEGLGTGSTFGITLRGGQEPSG